MGISGSTESSTDIYVRVSVCPAIDMTANIIQSLEVVVSVGCERVLTSGGEASALEGSATIRKMIEQTAGRVTVVPGTDCGLQWTGRRVLVVVAVVVVAAVHSVSSSDD